MSGTGLLAAVVPWCHAEFAAELSDEVALVAEAVGRADGGQ